MMNTSGVPHSIHDFPANSFVVSRSSFRRVLTRACSRLKVPFLIASILSLKCHLRERLVNAYKSDDRAELIALAGPEDESRMSRLRKLVKELHSVHRCVPLLRGEGGS